MVGKAVVQEEEQDSDTLQSSVSFCRTNSPKQIPMARELATAKQVLSGGGAVLGPGPGLRRPETDLRPGLHQVHMSRMAAIGHWQCLTSFALLTVRAIVPCSDYAGHSVPCHV